MEQPAASAPNLERLARRILSISTKVPPASQTSLSYQNFSPFFLPSRPSLIAWQELELALVACFSSFHSINTEEIFAGELGMELLMHAFKRLDTAEMDTEQLDDWEDWISALSIAVREQGRRHSLSRESAPEPVEEKVRLNALKLKETEQGDEVEIVRPLSDGRRGNCGGAKRTSEPVTPMSLMDDDEEHEDRDQKHRYSSTESSNSRSPTPWLNSHAPAQTRSATSLAWTDRHVSRKRSHSSYSLASNPRPSITASASGVSAVENKRLRQRAPSCTSSSNTVKLTDNSAPVPKSSSEWIKLVAEALDSLTVATGTLVDVVDAVRVLRPSIDSLDRPKRKVKQILTSYICFFHEDTRARRGRGGDGTDTSMWSFDEQWKASGLDGTALTRKAARAEDDDETSWCYCKKPYEGRDMLNCSNRQCAIKWFHGECVGQPAEMFSPTAKWYCSECKEGQQTSKNGGKRS